jgi:sulfite reductase (ferredoxin)
VPEALERILDQFQAERRPGEDFHEFIRRKGKESLKASIQDLIEVPARDADPSCYVDWSDAREFSTEDIGVGECAGEVVTPLEFELAACERELLAAQTLFDKGATEAARQSACRLMVRAARALLDWQGVTGRDEEDVVARFKTELCDTQLFFDPFVGGTFANYLFAAWEQRRQPADEDAVRRLLNEAQLFLDACHACYGRLAAARSAKRRETSQ